MEDNYKELIRIGYGSYFNKIFIDFESNKIKKICINNYGLKKINAEIKFFKYISKYNGINIPKIYEFLENGYIMEYLNNYESLYKIFYDFDNNKKKYILENIYRYINDLHNLEKIYVKKNDYINCLKIEIYDKIIDRYNLIKNRIEKYSYINTINNINFYNFNYLLEIINNKIINLVNNKTEYYYTIIHGDCQFNNILYNPINEKIYFIDPRGYFGNIDIFGIPEYDIAKIYFALSGYDEFDNRNIEYLDIQNNNINIKINIIDHSIFDIKNDLSILFMLNIWLGNAQCFMERDEIKGIYSYFIALYLGKKYIDI
jgi:hypothetical protein